MTPTIAVAFHDDIAAHPGDPTPRLIYADWLEDHGQDDLADLVRFMADKDKWPHHDTDGKKECWRWNREKEIVRTNGVLRERGLDEWKDPPCSWLDDAVWRFIIRPSLRWAAQEPTLLGALRNYWQAWQARQLMADGRLWAVIPKHIMCCDQCGGPMVVESFSWDDYGFPKKGAFYFGDTVDPDHPLCNLRKKMGVCQHVQSYSNNRYSVVARWCKAVD